MENTILAAPPAETGAAPATAVTAGTRHDFEDARHLIRRLEDDMPPRLRGKLQTARELLTEVENELADNGALPWVA